jgi:geranylgeranyl reductase family protein
MKIAIIGAGPAGAVAAARLARAGAAVTLFDPTHPREKPCGGGLTGRALALAADLVDIRTLPSVVIESALVEPPTPVERTPSAAGDAAAIPLTGGGAHQVSLVVLSRAVFDRALVNAALAAGARLEPERAIEVSRHGAEWIVRTDRREHRADHVLGADGATSVVRKKLARPFLRTQLSVAAGYFVHGATASSIAIRSMSEQPGYLWSFPRPDHLAVGICAPADRHVPSAVLRAQSREWIEHHGLGRGVRLVSYGWPIPSIGGHTARETPFAGPGWMLLGDAAGLVDPLTREGIYYALLSGGWAADALASDGPARAAGRYAERLNDEVRPEIDRAARLAGPFFTPRFAALLVRALRESGPVRDVFVDLVTGVQPYRGLRRRLLATHEWTLAARAIRMLLTPGFTGTMNPVVSSQATRRS